MYAKVWGLIPGGYPSTQVVFCDGIVDKCWASLASKYMSPYICTYIGDGEESLILQSPN